MFEERSLWRNILCVLSFLVTNQRDRGSSRWTRSTLRCCFSTGFGSFRKTGSLGVSGTPVGTFDSSTGTEGSGRGVVADMEDSFLAGDCTLHAAGANNR